MCMYHVWSDYVHSSDVIFVWLCIRLILHLTEHHFQHARSAWRSYCPDRCVFFPSDCAWICPKTSRESCALDGKQRKLSLVEIRITPACICMYLPCSVLDSNAYTKIRCNSRSNCPRCYPSTPCVDTTQFILPSMKLGFKVHHARPGIVWVVVVTRSVPQLEPVSLCSEFFFWTQRCILWSS